MIIDPLQDRTSAVERLDSMGSDATVVDSARVFPVKRLRWSPETRRVDLSEEDLKLLEKLAKREHWTPFAHVTFQFYFKMPLFLARQWYRHEVGFVRTEVSRRRSGAAPEFWYPEELRKTTPNGDGGKIRATDRRSMMLRQFLHDSSNIYKTLIAEDVVPELARLALPQACYTECVETGSLAAYARMYRQRIEGGQEEYLLYLDAVLKFIKEVCPASHEVLF